MLRAQLLVLAVLVLGGGAGVLWEARQAEERAAAARASGVAATVALAPAVTAALPLEGAPPAARAAVQPYAEAVRRATGTDFVVVMGTDRTRLSHPDPAQIGRTFLGTTAPALRGEAFTETFTGTLGPSVRAVVPVRASTEADAPVVGMVAVGVTREAISRSFVRQLPALLAALALALLLAAAGSVSISRWVRRSTHGMEPAELTRLYEYSEAVLHALGEGLLVVDRQQRLQLVNDEARRLLAPALDDAGPGTAVEGLPLPPALRALLLEGSGASDEVLLSADRVLLVDQAPAVWEGRVLGSVTTLRDHTRLRELSRDLDETRDLAEALRSQAHESANRLHTVVAMVEMGRTEDAVRFATAELDVAQSLTDLLVSEVEEPAVAALLLGKSAQAAEWGVELRLDPATSLTTAPVPVRDLLTVLGNLVDNAVEAALAAPAPRWVRVLLAVEGPECVVEVADSGSGIAAGDLEEALRRGWSRKAQRLRPDPVHGHGLGLALVGQVVRRHGGSVSALPAEPGAGSRVLVRLPVAGQGADEGADQVAGP
ncbi:sensor histidine kinase regulating citrate/malate metabolism [Kineococcus xinjiangensis]|uniref:histidine kinase n=1 Tax=Kineococcus xinjiangensis TaxID=512762 RepID=A0A2S6IGU7_9ACTN|nr:sensor histidine kinase regulating citrate/malate metabolism [Kineococcus xinjiangensis]